MPEPHHDQKWPKRQISGRVGAGSTRESGQCLCCLHQDEQPVKQCDRQRIRLERRLMERKLAHDNRDRVSEKDSDKSLVAANSRYVAFLAGHDLVVQTTKGTENAFWSFPLTERGHGGRTAIAFSPIQLSYLAISCTSKISIYDVEARKLKCVLSGVNRAVTAIAWSSSHAHTLATGCVDGLVGIWDITCPNTPTSTCQILSGPIRCIAWSPAQQGILAMSTDAETHVWQPHDETKPETIRNASSNHIRHLVWHPHDLNRLLTSNMRGDTIVWYIAEVLDRIVKQRVNRDEVFARQDTPSPLGFAARYVASLHELTCLLWTGDQTLMALHESGTRLTALDLGDAATRTVIYRTETRFPMSTLITVDDDFALAISRHQRLKYRSHLVKSDDDPLTYCVDTTIPASHDWTSKRRSGQSLPKDVDSRAMRPIAISSIKISRGQASQTDEHQQSGKRALQSSKRPFDRSSTEQVKPYGRPSSAFFSTPASITGTLAPQNNDEDVPMPFLSPSIPSKDSDPILSIAHPFDEASYSSMLAAASRGSDSSNMMQDSDSDDDAYDLGDSQHSSALMPGAVNVPRPRSCGALFAPNGTLVTILPPISRPQTARREELLSLASDDDLDDPISSKTAALFPSFGNLAAESHGRSDMVGVPWLTDQRSPQAMGEQPFFLTALSSFKTGSFPLGTPVRSSPSRPNMRISTRLLDEVVLFEHELAMQYITLRRSNETGSALCEHNAAVAQASGILDAAHMWRLVAMLLEDEVPLNMVQDLSRRLDVLVPATTLGNQGHGMSAARSSCSKGKLRWSDHPLGSHWLVRQLFDYADARADLQMLACMSAILADDSSVVNGSSMGSMAQQLATLGPSYSALERSKALPPPMTEPIPILQTEHGDPYALEESPTKLHASSQSFSRNASQPATPHVGTTPNTPPWTLQRLSQTTTSKTSLSGSASPEIHRSSFSAAVKSYAQSVSDKFASYGTSPPTKKGGTSPSNDLSSSLPSAGGSWSKSVSFASTISTTQNSLPSRNSIDQDVAYDSDRTIEDGSLPHTPKSSQVDFGVTWKNQHAFSDDVSGRAITGFLPPDLVPKCMIWVGAYAQRLQYLGLHTKAAEFEKVAGALGSPTVPSSIEESVRLWPKGAPASSCSICFCIVRGLEQVCPSCQHALHLTCLQQLLSSCPTTAFECPTGCGCDCTDAPTLAIRSTKQAE